MLSIFIAGILGSAIGAITVIILNRKHETYGGTIIIDLGIDSDDTIKVEGCSKLEDWMKADKIVFDKEVRG